MYCRICAVEIDAESGIIIKTESVENNSFIHTENSWEKIQSPEIILNKVKEIMKTFANEDIASIGVTGQMHSIVYIDKNGAAISPIYTWQDQRGDLTYKASTYAKELGSYTGYGNVTHFYNTVNNLVPENAAAFCTIHDYIAMSLTGDKRPILHASDAASLRLYDTETNEFKMNDKLLPEVTDEFCLLGKYKNIPVAVAIGDNQASIIGSGVKKGDVLVNVGIGSQVSVITDSHMQIKGIET